MASKTGTVPVATKVLQMSCLLRIELGLGQS